MRIHIIRKTYKPSPGNKMIYSEQKNKRYFLGQYNQILNIESSD